MYLILAVAAAIIALLVVGFGVFAAYMLLSGKRRGMIEQSLRRWTLFDYIILAVFLIGALFLLADVVGVLRDREAYPYYHYGYLLSGFAYNLLAGICMLIRLGLTLRMQENAEEASRGAPAADHHHDKPGQAQSAE